jgi:hypothetical protein
MAPRRQPRPWQSIAQSAFSGHRYRQRISPSLDALAAISPETVARVTPIASTISLCEIPAPFGPSRNGSQIRVADCTLTVQVGDRQEHGIHSSNHRVKRLFDDHVGTAVIVSVNLTVAPIASKARSGRGQGGISAYLARIDDAADPAPLPLDTTRRRRIYETVRRARSSHRTRWIPTARRAAARQAVILRSQESLVRVPMLGYEAGSFADRRELCFHM